MKGKNGFAMVMVIILIAFLSIVAIGLIALWQGAVSQLVQQEESMQAYYLARSGAAALATWVINHPSTATSIVGIKSNQIHIKNGSVGTVQVSLVKAGNNLTVVSTGMVNSARETLKLTIVQAQTGFNFTKAIITNNLTINSNSTINGGVEIQSTNTNTSINANSKINGNLQVNGSLTFNSNSTVNGDLQINGSNLTINSNVTVSGTIEINKNANVTNNSKTKYNIVYGNPPFFQLTPLPLPVTPTGLTQKPDITLNSNSSITISASVYYNNITLNSNNVLNFDTSKGSITVYVNNFTINSNSTINILGSNRVTLFIGNSFISNSNVTINNNNPNQFLIESNSNSNIVLNANSNFVGYIYAPKSSVTINSNVGITGGIVSNNFTLNSNCSLQPAFVPINFSNSGNSIHNFTVGSWSY